MKEASSTMHDAPKTLTLYVPANPQKAHGIAPGAAIVGRPGNASYDDERIVVDYEGAVNHQVMTFEEKVLHAAGRHAWHYPTVARMALPKEDLLAVGEVHHDDILKSWVIIALEDAARLEAWIGEAPPPLGGSQAVRERAAGLLWNKIPTSSLALCQQRAQHGENLSELIIDEARRRLA